MSDMFIRQIGSPPRRHRRRWPVLFMPPDWMMELPDIRRAIHHLVRDGNPDVRHFVSFLPPILGSELSQEDKVYLIFVVL